MLSFVGLLAWADGAGPNDAAAAADLTVGIDSPAPFPEQSLVERTGVQALTELPERASDSVAYYTTTVTLLTYPYADCLLPPQSGVAGVSYSGLDWSCLSGAGPPVLQTYTSLVLSNDYLTVTLLPELGGRVYEMIFKPTGHNELYRNPVLKPAPWGPVEQGWWLAAGGIEWGFPTDEHGYEWGVPWHYQVISSTAGVTVALRDSEAITRPTLSVAVFLPADQAVLFVRPEIANPTADPVGVKYWTNAMLAPGATNAPSADLRFLFPGDQVVVHSTGDDTLPTDGELMDWPVHNGRDYARLGNWNQWLGFFEAPQAHGPYAGVYDAVADEGVLRVYPAELARGSKGFGLGWADPLPASLWTDDGSSYVEVHGGLAPTFWDTTTLLPGEVVSWTEAWYPLAGVGGVTAAGPEAALRLEAVAGGLALGLYTPAAHEDVQLYLWRDDCTVLEHWRLSHVDPAHPVRVTVPATELTPQELSLAALTSGGTRLGSVNPKDCLAPRATVDPLPPFVTSSTFSVTWRGDDDWSGVADYDVQYRAGTDGDWRDWLTGTLAISSTFVGIDGQTYFFRVRARDKAGNVGAFGAEAWGEAFTTVLLTPSPVLVTSRKLVATPSAVLGQPVAYTIRLSNTGNLTANSVALTDHLPATLVLVSGTFRAGDGDVPVASTAVITWRGALTPGHELRLTYALTGTSATTLGVPLTNVLWLVADDLPRLVRHAAVTYLYAVYMPLAIQDAFTP